MRKIIENIKKFRTSYIITAVISIMVGLAIFFALYFTQKMTIVASINGTGVAFAVLLGAGGLAWLSRAGAFDTLTYGFTQAFTSMFAKEPNKHNDFVEYKDEKNAKRRSSGNYYFVIILTSLLFFIPFIALEIYFKVVFNI